MRSLKKPFFKIGIATSLVLSSLFQPAAAASSDDQLFEKLTELGYGIYLLESGFFKQADRKMSALIGKLDKQPVQKTSLLLPLIRSDIKCGDLQKRLFVEALEIRALSRQQLKQREPAIADLTRAIKICPDHPFLHLSLGKLYASSRRTKDASIEIDRALALNPNVPEALFAKASLLERLGKRKESRVYLSRAKKLSLERQRLLDQLSDKVAKVESQENVEEVLSADTELLSAFPRDVYAIKNYAEHLLSAGRSNQALRYSNLAIMLDPTFAGGYRARSKVYAQLDKPELELADATRAFVMEPRSGDALYARAIANLDMDRPVAAIRDFDLLLKNHPDFTDAYIGRSAAFGRTGQNEESIKDARKAYSLAPNSPYGYQMLGAALRKAQQLPEAKRALEESLRYSSKATPESLAMTRFNLGATLTALNDPGANEHIDAALKLAPNLPVVLLRRGTYDAREAPVDQGITVLTKTPRRKSIKTAASAASKSITTLNLRKEKRSEIVLSESDLRDCVLVCSRLIQLEPKNANAYYIRGTANFCLGRYKPAEDDFNLHAQLSGKPDREVMEETKSFLLQNESCPRLKPSPSALRVHIRKAEARMVSSKSQS